MSGRVSAFISVPVALAVAVLTGWLQIMFRDLHLALLSAMGFALLLGVCWPRRPWVWALLIGLSPALGEFVLIARGEPIQRGEVEASFAAVLPAIVGAYGGHFMRLMVSRLFEKPQQPTSIDDLHESRTRH